VKKWLGEHTINAQPVPRTDETGAGVIDKRWEKAPAGARLRWQA